MGGDRDDEEPTDADREPPEDPESEARDDVDPEPVSLERNDADGPVPDEDERDEPALYEEEAGEPEVSADELAEATDEVESRPSDFDRLADIESGVTVESNAGDDDADGDETDADDSTPETLEDVEGIGEAKADALRDAGFESVDDLQEASEADLTEVRGIGDALSARIKADVAVPDFTPDETGDGTDVGQQETEVGPDDDGEKDSDVPDVRSPDLKADHSAAVEPDDEPLLSGPETDEEMPLTAHIEEMIKRLVVVVAIAGLVSVVTFPFAERIINFLWYNILPGVPSEIARPRLYGVLELIFTKLKVASLAGVIIALPALVYETYQFMRPGLYPHERRYYLAAIPASLVLALVGVSFAYFIVLPAIFTYFLAYSQDVATIGFALGRTFNLILVLMGYLALVFQIPLFIMLAMMMGLVTRRWLADRRLLFWGAFLGISFLFSPDPTGMAPVIIALTMVGLFEGTLLLTKWTGRG